MSLVTDPSDPPAYYTLDDITLQLSKLLSDQAAAHTFQTAVTQHLKSSATRKALYDEIENLAQTVTSIETDFANIAFHMRQIDQTKRIVDKEKNPIEFAPRWKILHDEYTSLVDDSQSTAGKVSNKIHELLNIILPLLQSSELDKEAKGKHFDDYIKELETFQDKGQKNAARFSHLKRDVDTFRSILRETVVHVYEGTKTEVEETLKKVDKEIAKLQAELEKSSKFFAKCWDILRSAAPDIATSSGATVAALGAAGGVAATAGLAALAPPVGIAILIAGLAALGFALAKAVKKRAEQRQAKTNDLIALQLKRDEAVFSLQQMEELVGQLNDLDKVFDGMIERLSAIQNIWSMLLKDSQELRRTLSVMKTTDSFLSGYPLENMKLTYSMLQLALDQFCLAIAS